MHEMSLALEILEICKNSVEEMRPGRLNVIKVAVGELSAVEPDLLTFAWEAITKDSPDMGSVLEVEFIKADQYCKRCGEKKERHPGSWLSICPDCMQPMEVTGGRELDIVSVTFLKDE